MVGMMGLGLWFMVYGLWVMVYGLWVMGYGFMVYGLWVYGLWVMGLWVYGLWFMVYGFMGLWVLTLSPNPCRDFVILNVKEKFAKTLKMTITDVSGKSLQSGQLNLDNGFTTIYVTNIPAGSYFMTLKDAEGGQEVVQFVKM